MRWTAPVFVALVAIGCSATDDATAEDPPAAPTTTTVAAFCTPFPTRDASTTFDVPDEPGLEGNDQVIDQLLDIAANGLEESAPIEIKDQVATYVAALRDYQPGVDPRDDPDIRAAAEDIDQWLRANCPPPPATVP